jgi:methylase of polypeptide subunit release factors
VAVLDPARVGASLEQLLAEVDGERLPKSHTQSLAGLRCTQQLAAACLVDERGCPRFRVNRIGRRVFVTDMPELTRHGGVFPYEDEAERLLGYLRANGLDAADTTIDVGMGCGHVLLSTDADTRVGIDISARAGALLGLNAQLNGEHARWVQGDAVQALVGLPELSPPTGRTVIVGNLPHAPVPVGSTLAAFADGGRTGAQVIEAVLSALAREASAATEIVLLCYSLASSSAGEPLVATLATRLFPANRVRWTALSGSPMWRIAGSMSEVSPMALATGLPRKADCPYYTGEDRRERVRASYEALAAELQEEGWDQLAYGVLHIRSCASREASG